MTTIAATDRIPVQTRRRPSRATQRLRARYSRASEARSECEQPARNLRSTAHPAAVRIGHRAGPGDASAQRARTGLPDLPRDRHRGPTRTARMHVRRPRCSCRSAKWRPTGAAHGADSARPDRVRQSLVAVLVSGLQLGALLLATYLRGAHFNATATGIGWFVGAAGCFAVAMYSIAEIMANRIPSQEEYVGAVPAVAIVPWFIAGSLFPISALPAGLTAIAKALPLTHVLALMRYGLLDRHGAGLRDIWGMANTTVMATLSTAVVVAYAILFLALALRVFRRAAVR